MQITSFSIRNFKSIQEIRVDHVDSAMIVVGKNSAGKTAILDGLLAAFGVYQIRPSDFNMTRSNVEVDVTLRISQADLELLNRQGVVCKYKRMDIWLKEFSSRLPSFRDGILQFTFEANYKGDIRYGDGVRKNNKYIPQLLPKVYYIDTSRSAEEIQNDIILSRGEEALRAMQEHRCMFDSSKSCSNCFQCIGVIHQKKPEDLSVYETVKLLEYKMVHLDMDDFLDRLNQNFTKNSGLGGELIYQSKVDSEQLAAVEIALELENIRQAQPVSQMSAGMKSIYILSLLETYMESGGKLPCIIMIEDPEIYLHPQMQKVASEILYRLSLKNQVIFSTHSPNMIFNFNSRQIKQVVMDRDYHTVVRPQTNIDAVLDDLGYSANDLMDVSFVFFVEGKQDRNRLPLLLEKYYSEIYDEEGQLMRIAIIATNSCTNIKAYANLKYMNKLYIRDQFLMIRDSDGKDREMLADQLCSHYRQREKEEPGVIPRVTRRNVLILRYYSFENYFLNPEVMTRIGVVSGEEEFYNTLYTRYCQYLHKLSSFQNLQRQTGIKLRSVNDLREHLEEVLIYGRGHNLYDIFYGRYKGQRETDILRKYIDAAPREVFRDILEAIDQFVYFHSRKRLCQGKTGE